jgi:autotransporter-associated beta strand protein
MDQATTPYPHIASNRRRRRLTFCLCLSLALIAAIAAHESQAALLTWDANPAITNAQDGAGIWDNQNVGNWWNGSENAQWNNDAPDSATFGTADGNAGLITLGSDITVNGLTFNQAGSGNYTIAGGGHSLTLSNTIIGGTASASITAGLAGNTGLSITNSGTIALSGANTYSGATTIVNGTLQLEGANALGGSTQITVGDANGATGTVRLNVPDATSTTFGTGTSITIHGSGVNGFGALRGEDGASNTWAGNVVIGSSAPTISAGISGGNGGTLNVKGVISGTGSIAFSTNSNATTILSNINTYTGATRLRNTVPGTLATLRIGTDNAINAASDLIGGGPVALDLGGHMLTLRALNTTVAHSPADSANVVVTNSGSVPSTLTINGRDILDPFSIFGGSIQDGSNVTSVTKTGHGIQVLVGINTYTGPTAIDDGLLQIGQSTPLIFNSFVGSNGRLASAKISIKRNSALHLLNEGEANNSTDRLSDSADLTFHGGQFLFTGTNQPGLNSSEIIQDLHLNSDISLITIRSGTSSAATVTANALVREPRAGIAIFNGAGLGRDGTSTGGVPRILFSNPPPLVGTTLASPNGINSASKNTQIVPFLLGETNMVSGGLGTSTYIPNTFLTYEPTTGLRPLNLADEFTNNSIVTGSNTWITASTTSAGTDAVNSLVVRGATLSISQTLTNTSGAILFSGGRITGGVIDFGSAEGVITVNASGTSTIDSKITGTNGITMYEGAWANGEATLSLWSPNSTYSGSTTITAGILELGANSTGPAGSVTSGPLGTSTLVLAGGHIGTVFTTPVNIGNRVTLEADAEFADGGGNLTFSGPVTITNGTRRFTNQSFGKTLTFSGSIDDEGHGYGLNLNGISGPIVVSGTATYSGTTRVGGNVIVSGSLFGDGTVIVVGGVLSGSGSVGNLTAMNSGATIDPGNTANVAGNLRTNSFSLNDGAHLSMQISKPISEGFYDRITASGPVALDDADLKLSRIGSIPFGLGDHLYIVINNSGTTVIGTFATVNGTAFDPMNFLVGGQQFRLQYNGNYAGPNSDGMANDVVLVAIPEPRSWLTLVGTLFLSGLTRRCRKISS